MSRDHDGTSADHIDVADSSDLQNPSTAITLGCWCYITNDPGDYSVLLGKGYANYGSPPYVSYNIQQFSTNIRQLEFVLGLSGAGVSSSGSVSALSTNTWYFAAGRWSSGNTMELRVFNADGSLHDSATGSSFTDSITYDTTVFKTCGQNDSGDYIAARIANILVADTSYTDEQIKTFMFTGRPVGATDLLMPLLESTVADHSGKDGAVTVNGTSIADSPPIAPIYGFDNIIPFPAAAGGDTNVLATTDSLTLTTYSATVNAETSIAATTDSLALSEQSATIALDKNVSATTDALTLTENSATVNAERNIQASVDALTLTEYAATISTTADTNVNCNTDALTLTENTANVNAETNVQATTDALTVTTYSATVTAGVNVSANVVNLTLTENTATVNAERNVEATAAVLSLVEYAATIDAGGTGISIDGATSQVLSTDYGSLKIYGARGNYYTI